MTTQRARLVWDLPLRTFHWLLVLSVLASWITGLIGYDVRQYHMWLGYWMIGLLAFRIGWGIVGTKHARFASFVPTPRSLVRHVRELIQGQPARSVGHDPLGSLMVFAMLLLLALQATSGLFADDDILYAGPLNGLVSEATADFFSGLHHEVVNVIVTLAALHIVAVLYYTLRKKQRLIHAMWDGRKPADLVAEDEAIGSSRVMRAAIVAAAAAVFVYWLVAVMPGA